LITQLVEGFPGSLGISSGGEGLQIGIDEFKEIA
jgi:hypothetical protein